ncbi:tRNA (adenosine(37)-N6)-dimethylallyltransferase MiaA [Roseivivax sp. GX 12232]|uniref:tRNA (adenosine(37)-N6)-dimethylallyltransferase MiaA n=1 Tax=Roseivivax sp. GX 12232 TaxID=2900547 RepID=UPI001E414311|nr:tRNA (adenosine(37)-N6)-dimethylallyltransferase MiaA [Roseivivax sp. GX 12232]MCE0504943.1 tRNA (adenosine(37)-N6)-dimethylallyltransferase MiaA [Roseivivax sp. GX 12232]
MIDLSALDPRRPVLIAGPTASGKSGLALRIAEAQGGVIVNADAIQVFSDWRVLTARPAPADEARAPHALYGHVPGHEPYSVGAWLREAAPYLEAGPRPIFVGGTGLYFTALTRGLAQIPPIPQAIREEAMARLEADGPEALLPEIDAETARGIDRQNPMRVQRAWEVLRATGRGLAAWQADTPPPLLPLARAQAFVIGADKGWLTPRIATRFEQMIAEGALDEAKTNAPGFTTALPSAKAIGARELIAHVRGEMSLEDAMTRAIIQTRQFAKRQRSWFRSNMAGWRWLDPERAEA